MSTVQSLLDNIGPRADSSTVASMYPFINLAIRTIAKRLYYLRSDILREAMEVSIFASVNTYELLTLDVEPSTAWAAGDTITGATSGKTCKIISVITTKTFYIDERTGDFTLSEVLSNGVSGGTADQGAAHPTTTSLMALVDSNPDTITYAGAQFIVEGFHVDMPITTSHASNPGPFRIDTVAAGTLTLHDTDAAVAATSNSFIITSDASYGFLPDGFWGLIDEPYIGGKTYSLRPLPSQAVVLQYPGPGEPIYYQLKGSKIYVTPPTSADYTIKGDYFSRPTAVAATTSIIPWDELFDDAIGECIMQFYRKGFHEQNYENPPIEAFLRREVDLIAAHYGRISPKVSPGIDWGGMK